MVTVSFDPDAGTLYWYFTEIEAGSTDSEGECNGALLLDASGQVVGVELELDESIGRADLALALDHPQVRYDRPSMTLTVLLAEEEPAEVQPLHETLILDFDQQGRLQGCDLVASAEFELSARLVRLEPFRVALEDAPPEQLEDEVADDDDDEDDSELIDGVEETADDEDDSELIDDAEETADDEDEDVDEGDLIDDDDAPPDALDENLVQEPDDDEDLDEDLAQELRDTAALEPNVADDIDDELVDEDDADQLDEETPDVDDEHVIVVATADETPVDPPLLTPPATAAAGFRSGFVALVGKPNVGKSTLLNALLGQKVAIVSPKPQTTRVAQRGILNRPDAQLIFVDTPGIHDPRTKLGSYMVEQARRSIPDADVVCFVVDISLPPNRIEQRIADLARRARAARILVLNKLDQRPRGASTHLDEYRAMGPWDMEVAVSALLQKGLKTLLDELVRRLPVGPALYPEDQVTDQSEREHAAELVREQVLRHIEQEVPHGVAVEVEEWEEKEKATYIRMTIYVEKDSQKGILIGASGAMLKRIGSGARRGIEESVGRTVYLELWVKVRPNWRDDPSSLHWLGYRGS